MEKLKLRLQELAARRLEQALLKTPNNFFYLFEWAKVLIELSLAEENKEKQKQMLQRFHFGKIGEIK